MYKIKATLQKLFRQKTLLLFSLLKNSLPFFAPMAQLAENDGCRVSIRTSGLCGVCDCDGWRTFAHPTSSVLSNLGEVCFLRAALQLHSPLIYKSVIFTASFDWIKRHMFYFFPC